jgi:hypothetical protein
MIRILLPLVLSLSFANSQAMEQVFIDSDEFGQGFITKHLNRCFFIAPFHVVKDSVFLNLIGDDSQRSIGEGQLIQEFGYDLAVGSVEGKLASNCTTQFNALESNTNKIESNNTFAISTVNADGMVSRQNMIAVETNLTHIIVQPVSNEHMLYKGMSGSLLYLDDEPLGMLQSIESNTGFGKVLRFDRLLETLNPFFNGNSSLTPSVEKSDPQTANTVPFEIAEWSLPAANQNSSVSMISDDDDTTAWEVNLDGQILELTLTLPEKSEISGLSLVSEKNGKASVRSFEVLTSKRSSGKRGWISQVSYSTFPKDTKNDVNWITSVAKRIKIRFYNSWNPNSRIVINSIKIN